MDYYKILNVDIKATDEEIRKAYHKMALKYHPDKNKASDAEERFKEVVEAYEVLSDPFKRRGYNLSRRLNEEYKFTLSDNILKFSKHFFSQENISKFTDVVNNFSDGMSNYGISINFELILNNFLNNIRNGKYRDIYDEYKQFRKFYDIDFTKVNLDEDEILRKYQENLKKSKQNSGNKKQKKTTENNQNENENENEDKLDINKIDDINKIRMMNRKKKEERQKEENKLKNKEFIYNKSININVNVSLENIYNRELRSANIKLNVRCVKCEGEGVINKKIINIDTPKPNKNSRNKKKKKKLKQKKK